jgi:CubicO group peptidase (beta-lactamase class C family)
MHRSQSAAVILTIALAPTPAHPQAPLDGGWRKDVERFAQSLVDARLVPGMGVAVTQGDRVVYSHGFGIADAASGRRVDKETAFYIASSTKALTATAVLALATRKELDLSASLAHYLPSLGGGEHLNAASITLRDLLTMSHGIEDSGPVGFRTAYSGVFSAELLLELLAEYRQSGKVGQFRYSNLGYNILGLVLDPRQRDGWKDVVKREVLDPLAMRETNARVYDFEPRVVALPHDYSADGMFRRIRLGKADANMHAAGGHFASARDLARFVAAHSSGGRLDGVQVFPSEMIAAAHRKQIDQAQRSWPFDRFGWGYGWDLSTYDDQTIVHRFGAFSGYHSHMSFMPNRGIGVVVLVNGSGPATTAADVMATFIYDRINGRPNGNAAEKLRMTDLQARADAFKASMANDIAARRARVAPLQHPLQDYAGVYDNFKYGRMEWRVVAGALESRIGEAHTSAEVFDAKQNQLRVDFLGYGEVVEFAFLPSGGSARSLQYRGERFERVKEAAVLSLESEWIPGRRY